MKYGLLWYVNAGTSPGEALPSMVMPQPTAGARAGASSAHTVTVRRAIHTRTLNRA